MDEEHFIMELESHKVIYDAADRYNKYSIKGKLQGVLLCVYFWQLYQTHVVLTTFFMNTRR